MLADAGCETYGYASDITRTFPIGNQGKFTDEVKEIYSIVLEMQEVHLHRPLTLEYKPLSGLTFFFPFLFLVIKAALKTIKAGVEWQEIQVLM